MVVEVVPIEKIEKQNENEWQPRSTDHDTTEKGKVVRAKGATGLVLDGDAIVDSVREHGIREPIQLWELPTGRFRILAGNRRFQAYRIVFPDATDIEAVVVRPDKDKVDAKEAALRTAMSNIVRLDISPSEKIAAYETAHEHLGTWEKVAAEAGISVKSIYRTLALKKVPKEILDSLGEARTRALYVECGGDLEEVERYGRDIAERHISASDVAEYVRDRRGKAVTAKEEEAQRQSLRDSGLSGARLERHLAEWRKKQIAKRAAEAAKVALGKEYTTEEEDEAEDAVLEVEGGIRQAMERWDDADPQKLLNYLGYEHPSHSLRLGDHSPARGSRVCVALAGKLLLAVAAKEGISGYAVRDTVNIDNLRHVLGREPRLEELEAATAAFDKARAEALEREAQRATDGDDQDCEEKEDGDDSEDDAA